MVSSSEQLILIAFLLLLFGNQIKLDNLRCLNNNLSKNN